MKKQNKNPKLNESGCMDLTAFNAITNVVKEEKNNEMKVSELIKVIKYIVDVSGFEIVNRIGIKDKKTKKIYW